MIKPSDNRLRIAGMFIQICEDLDLHKLTFQQLHIMKLTTIYVVSSYLYYKKDEPILNDEIYDKLCKYLLDNLDQIQNSNVYYKHLFTRDALAAGTGFDLNYPSMHENLAEDILYLLLSNSEIRDQYVKFDTANI